MKKQAFYLLSVTLTLVSTLTLSSCNRLMDEDEDFEIKNYSTNKFENNHQVIPNIPFEPNEDVFFEEDCKFKNDSISIDKDNKSVHDSIKKHK